MNAKRLSALLLTLLIAFSLPFSLAEAAGPVVSAGNETGVLGKTVDLPISISDNPGIVSIKISVGYDSDYLQLVSTSNGMVFGSVTPTLSQFQSDNPYTIFYSDGTATENHSSDGTLISLKFKLLKEGKTDVSVTFGSARNTTEKVTFTTQAGSVTINPSPVNHTVSFNTNGHGSAPANQNVEHGQKATEPAAPVAEGYTFGGWFSDTACEYKYNFSSAVNSDLILFAKWTINTYNVSFDMNGHGSSPATQSVEHGKTAAEPSAPVTEGYTFAGWFSDAACSKKYDFTLPVKADLVLYAKWTVNSYSVSFNMNGHGSSPVTQSIEYGKTATEPDTPVTEGFTFGGWYSDSDCEHKYDFASPIRTNLDLYAKWNVNSYTVSFNMNGHGSSVAAQSVEHGKTATEPSAPVTEGYTFAGWFSDAACEYKYNFALPVKADLVLYAKWIVNSYNVSFNMNGHGTSPANQSVEYGKKVSEPASPSAEGYTFGGWYTEAACKYKYNFASPVKTDFVLYAKWTVNSYTVTFNMSGFGNAVPSQTVVYGERASEPSAPSFRDYDFGGWYKEAKCINEFDFSTPVTSDITLYAKWLNPTADTVINVAGAQKINWRTKVTIKATASNIPADRGYSLQIVVDGKTYTGEKTGENTMEVTIQIGEIKKDITYSVKVVDENGNISKDGAGNDLAKDGGKITVNRGFFKRLVAFFKGLFKKLPSTTVKP